MLEEHEGEQADGFGLVRHQFDQEAAEADRLLAQFVTDEAFAG